MQGLSLPWRLRVQIRLNPTDTLIMRHTQNMLTVTHTVKSKHTINMCTFGMEVREIH